MKFALISFASAFAGASATPNLLRCVSSPRWDRPYGNVATTVAGLESCRDQCKNGGYKYWGTECPMTTQVHCQCSNAESLAAAGPEIDDAECNTDAHSPKHHCVGPFSVGPYGLGAANVGTVYSTVAAPTFACINSDCIKWTCDDWCACWDGTSLPLPFSFVSYL